MNFKQNDNKNIFLIISSDKYLLFVINIAF